MLSSILFLLGIAMVSYVLPDIGSYLFCENSRLGKNTRYAFTLGVILIAIHFVY